MKRPLILGNWKLNGNKQIIHKLITNIRKEIDNLIHCDVVVCPPVIYLDMVKRYLIGSNIFLGAQNVDIHSSGAFTGEISAYMLKDIGTKYVIIGHSERRMYHNETNDDICKKLSLLNEQNLIPVLCIGENQVEKNNGKTKSICIYQIDSILNKVDILAFDNIVIAYEPIWAIGTGYTASPREVQQLHKFIRTYIAQYNDIIAKKISIIYGGSVNNNNAYELLLQPDIDGLLIGSASLKFNIFSSIIKSALLLNIKT